MLLPIIKYLINEFELISLGKKVRKGMRGDINEKGKKRQEGELIKRTEKRCKEKTEKRKRC